MLYELMLVADVNAYQRAPLLPFIDGVMKNKQRHAKPLRIAKPRSMYQFIVFPLDGTRQSQNFSHWFDVVRQLRLRVVPNASRIER
jgi:hypothetical protein